MISEARWKCLPIEASESEGGLEVYREKKVSRGVMRALFDGLLSQDQ